MPKIGTGDAAATADDDEDALENRIKRWEGKKKSFSLLKKKWVKICFFKGFLIILIFS